MIGKEGLIRIAGAGILMAYLAGCGSSGTRRIVVADAFNNRVLIFEHPFAADEAASVALGQANFTDNSSNPGAPTASTLATPVDVAVDPKNGRIGVADAGNCRVVGYQPPFTTGMAATLVLGEPDDHTACAAVGAAATASTLADPEALAFDRSQSLWVVDFSDSRVLEYKAPLTSGMAASVAIGQLGLVGSTGCNLGAGLGAGVTDATLCNPTGVALDPKGNLWVSDTRNNRLLEFVPIAGVFTSGMSASVVLGQLDFVSSGINQGLPAATDSTLRAPTNITFDSKGNLWVSDTGNNRVLEFKPVAGAFTNGMAASTVLGQPSFVSSGSGTTATTIFSPRGLSFERNGELVLSDSFNNRVLTFAPPFVTGMAATTVVLGQPNLTSGAPNQGGAAGANTLDRPIGVATSSR